MEEMVCCMVPVPKDTHTHTQSSKAARLCGAPVCPRHTETDRGSLSFTRRLKQWDRVTWSETRRERGRGRQECSAIPV